MNGLRYVADRTIEIDILPEDVRGVRHQDEAIDRALTRHGIASGPTHGTCVFNNGARVNCKRFYFKVGLPCVPRCGTECLEFKR